MGELERKLEARCNEHAERSGWQHAKLEKGGRGWPDRIYFGPCAALLIVEFKRPGEKPRAQQAAVHRNLDVLGHPVSVVSYFSQFVSLMDAAAALSAALPPSTRQ